MLVELSFLGKLLVGYAFGMFFMYGGVLYFHRALTEQYEKLTFSRFRILASAFGVEDNNTVLRGFWFLGGPLCFIVGLGYIVAITWFLLT